MRRACLLSFAVAMLWSAAAFGDVRAFLDRPTVLEGDVVTLNIESETLTGSGQPDLSPLAEDFEVRGTSTGSEIRIINGRRSMKRTWRIGLLPKRLGEIRIPALSVGDERTQPLTLTVSRAPAGARGEPGDDVFIEVEPGIDGDSVLVQQQIPLVVRLYSALPIRGGELSEPRAEGAVLERLGADTQYETTRNGREYRVIERRFSLSPERSGELRIPPVVFEGELREQPRSRDRIGRLFDDPSMDRLFGDPVFGDSPFSMFERGEPVRAQSEAITLTVESRPAGFGGEHWLPAEAVAVADSWADQPPMLRVGEPATRTLTITARGLAGTQIPEIEIPVPQGMRAYPEQTQAQSRTDGSTLFGVSKQSVTVIPTAGGAVEMPQIRVPWWDVEAERERAATVPALRLSVEGTGSAAPQTAAPAAEQRPSREQAADTAPPDASEAGQAGNEGTANDGTAARGVREPGGLPWLALAAALALAAGVAAAWRRWRGWKRTGTAADSATRRQPTRQPPSMRRLRDDVRRACEDGDPHAAARALLAWAQARWPERQPTNLGTLAARFDAAGISAAAAGVRDLEQELYGPRDGRRDSQSLWASLSTGLDAAGAPPRQAESSEPLQPLYPHRS
jgi:hypothetical protein